MVSDFAGRVRMRTSSIRGHASILINHWISQLLHDSAYIENPNDWLYQKNLEKTGRAPKFDYANANVKDPKQVLLTSIWATMVIIYAANAIYFVQTGGKSIF